MLKIHDNNAFLMAMGRNSRIEIHAKDASKDSWTQINETAEAGSDTLVLAEDDTGWQIGDRIAIASTGFDMDEAEYRTITNIDGRTVTLDAPLEHSHFGQIETHNNGKTGEDYREWELDMRAEVALLSRNVTLQGDEANAIDQYGGHTMIMNGAAMHIDGAELTRMGQAGDVGRYPLHWHMLGDATGQYVTNSSVHETYNKGITIHGTQNAWLENNALVNNIGHAYYFEDGSEFGNVLLNNLGMNTVAAPKDKFAIGTDHTEVSTYWVTNPNNHLIGNHAAGSDDTGFWILSQDHAEGKSSSVYPDLVPREATPGTWIGNVSHSNKDDGIFIGAQFDERDGSKSSEPTLEVPFRLEDFTAFKNGEWGIWLRNGRGDFEDIKIADTHTGIQNWGDSNLRDSVFVGRSSNFEDGVLEQYVGWQLYDHPFSFKDVHFAGYTGEEDATISNGWGFGRSTAHSVEGITFADDGTANHKFLHTLTLEREDDPSNVSDQGGVTAGAITDLDGSFTGTPGSVITPGIVDWNPGKHYEIANYAEEGISAAGFNGSEGAQWNEDYKAWFHQPGTVIGKVAIFDGYVTMRQEERENVPQFDANGNPILVPRLQDAVPMEERSPYTITRSDNKASIAVNQDAIVAHSWEYQFNVDTSDGVEYIVEFVDKLPEAIKFDFTDLPEGATAYYRFKGLPDEVTFWEADAAATIEEFNANQGTTWFQEDSGDYVVKVYADRFLHFRSPRTDNEFIEERIYNDEFAIIIDNRFGVSATPDGNPYTTREEHPHVAATPDPAPEEKPESTSDTVEIRDSDPRWSDAGAWEGAAPDEDSIVYVGPGRRLVLDTDASVQGIVVNGGELVVADVKDMALAADWILVINGGLFQVGTEDSPFQHDFDLTLKGDDENGDVDAVAIMASVTDDVARVVAPETSDITETTVTDTDNKRHWDTQTDYHNDTGNLLQRELTYDNGNFAHMTYHQNGELMVQTQLDLADESNWQRLSRTFDMMGNLSGVQKIHDDGRIQTWTYKDSVVQSAVQLDDLDAKDWKDKSWSYDQDGELVRAETNFDDGRWLVHTYQDGVRKTTSVTDWWNSHKGWYSKEKTFDENGKAATSKDVYDDKVVVTGTYVNGVRATELFEDLENAKSWSTIQKTFDDNGTIAQTITTYDDGRVATTEFANGRKALHTVLDEGDEFVWASRVTTYTSEGEREAETIVLDDGTENFRSFVPQAQPLVDVVETALPDVVETTLELI